MRREQILLDASNWSLGISLRKTIGQRWRCPFNEPRHQFHGYQRRPVTLPKMTIGVPMHLQLSAQAEVAHRSRLMPSEQEPAYPQFVTKLVSLPLQLRLQRSPHSLVRSL